MEEFATWNLLYIVLDSVSPTTPQILSLSHSSNFVNVSRPTPDSDSSAGVLSPVDSTSHALSTTHKIGVVIHDRGTEVPMRINTLHNFYEMNRKVCHTIILMLCITRTLYLFLKILSGTAYSLPVNPKDRSLIDQRAQISVDSIVGESTQISERTTIKRSVIGRHCIIGKMVKITGSILLDHCIVEDG